MATQRRYSIEFKRQVVQEYQAGETLHGLAKRHGISRNLIRFWAAKAEAGEFDDDLAAAEHSAGVRSAHRFAGAPSRQAGARERASKGGFAQGMRELGANVRPRQRLVIASACQCPERSRLAAEL
jgi:transposase-like protein